MSFTNSKVDQHQTTSHAQEIDNHIQPTSDNNCLQPNIEMVQLTQQIEELYIKYNRLVTVISNLENAVDDLQQYSRRNCLILHGCTNMPESKSNYDAFEADVVKILNHHLKTSLSSNEIDVTHPLPPSKSGTSKIPVIIKFI